MLTQIKSLLKQNRHRKLCVLQGSIDWQITTLLDAESCATINQLVSSNTLIHSEIDQISSNVDLKTFRQHLGKEYSAAVFIGDKVHPDMFAALAGTLKAGGIFYWLISDSFGQDNYAKRFYRFFKEHGGAIFISEGGTVQFPSVEVSAKPVNCEVMPYGALSAEQVNAVDSILRVASGHRNRPFVLTADRGRGKSAALALAVAQLFHDTDKQHQIIITASNKLSIQTAFELLHDKLPDSHWQNNSFSHKQHTLKFLPIDEIIRSKPDATLLLVDEAAGIPLYLLKRLLAFYSRSVFSSTLHGYEGAGRGFALKFNEILIQEKQQATWGTLTKPVRWNENDPLENFVFDACLLNAELPAQGDFDSPVNQLCFETLDREQLAGDENLLKQVFSLLVTAHYQTSADDLQLLLNNTLVKVMTLSSKGNYLAVALIIEEGDVTAEEKEGILAGKRRLKDQFIPQLLSAHAGIREAFDFSYWRIMRIAVHPSIQGEGLGSELLSRIRQKALALECDVLATSFGINKQLLKFWHQNGYITSRVGISKDKSSGEHSGVLLLPVTSSPNSMIKNIQQEFLSYFSYLLHDEFNEFSPQLVTDILRTITVDEIPTCDFDRENLSDFALGRRQFDYCAHSIGKFVLSSLVIKNTNVAEELVALCLMRWSKKRVIDHYGLQGKKALNQHLLCQAKALMATHFK